jgi:hypothetical protein
MKKPSRPAEIDVLIREIQRYLAFVEALRGGGPGGSGPDGKLK